MRAMVASVDLGLKVSRVLMASTPVNRVPTAEPVDLAVRVGLALREALAGRVVA